MYFKSYLEKLKLKFYEGPDVDETVSRVPPDSLFTNVQKKCWVQVIWHKKIQKILKTITRFVLSKYINDHIPDLVLKWYSNQLGLRSVLFDANDLFRYWFYWAYIPSNILLIEHIKSNFYKEIFSIPNDDVL